MREIKFRAWDGIKMWVSPDGPRMRADTTGGIIALNDWLRLCNDGNPWVLMQFTGLKDKNGKDVYEGDILLTDDMYHDYEDGVAINALPDGKFHSVEYHDGAFFAGDELLLENATAWEIIGNLCENPELLDALKQV